MSLSIIIPACTIVFLMVLGVPVWISMFVGVLPFFVWLNSMNYAASTAIQRIVSTMESESYLAIPFFVTAGVIMNYSGISKRLMNFADALVGHLTGGLGHVNILLSVLMGGVSGAASADAAMECKILVPEMKRLGYDENYSAAITLASSLITPIIPPGTGLIVYAMLAEVSVGRMFAAGYLPGITVAVIMMIMNGIISKKKGYKGSREKMASLKEIGSSFIHGFWALIIPFGLMMALRGGLFTATEAGAVLCVYALIIGAFVYKETKITDIWPIIKESIHGSATVMMTICGACTMSYWLKVERIPNLMANAIVESGLSKIGFLLLVVTILLIYGMFANSGTTIFTPILAPIAAALGIDLIQFGIVVVFAVCIGNMTPPFGIVLYQVAGLLDIKLEKLSKACIPFIIMMFACAYMWAFVPFFSTFLPKLMYG